MYMAMPYRPGAAVLELSRSWLLPSAAMGRRWHAPAVGLLYISVLEAAGVLHGGNVLLGLLGLLDVYNEKSRRFLRVFLPCIVTGAIYDSLRFFLQAAITGRIHVAGPYALERALFGVGGHTLNELFQTHHWAFADLAAGFAYLAYVPEYLALAMLLFFRRDLVRALTFARGFLVLNVMGFATWFVYPAAPPWYVAAHGFGSAHADALPSAAAAQRFDALLGTHVFANVYGHNVAVFGALPSLHVAYPMLATLLAFRTKMLRWARWPAAGYFALMCFSAVYLQHHYVIDVVLGITYALATLAIVLAWERRDAAAGRTVS
jgi:hypothetical protein